MKNVILIVDKKNVCHVHKFATITEAYRFYLKKYSTFGDWWYYLRVAHTLLNRVHGEDIMKMIFQNAFGENVCLTFENPRG